MMFFASNSVNFWHQTCICVLFFVLDECKVYHYIQHVDSVNIYQVSRIAAIAISINQCYHIRIIQNSYVNAAVKILWFQDPP